MSSNVTAEEASALLEGEDGAPRSVEVLSRDFREPKRLSPAQLARLARLAARATEEIGSSLRVWLRTEFEVEIESVSEVHAASLIAGLRPPLCLLAFECAGRNGWAIWDPVIATTATEIALGAVEVKEPKARTLTAVERGVLCNMLGRVIALVAKALDVETKNVRYVADELQLDLERVDAREGDPQRVALHVSLTGALGDSVLRVYLCGIKPPPVGHGSAAPAAAEPKHGASAPEHLHDLPVELSAQLGTAEVALADLLRLEAGDVIPLNADATTPIAVYVDGEPCASARFGTHQGRLAIQIHSIGASAAETQH